MPTRRSRIYISPQEKQRRETVALVAEGIETDGEVVIELPQYAKHAYQAIWGRDYSALQPEDAQIFLWLDDEVDAGAFYRGPCGAGITYYSTLGTAAFKKPE